MVVGTERHFLCLGFNLKSAVERKPDGDVLAAKNTKSA